MGYQVLVVEDDNFLRTVYATKLTKAGFTIEIATDGIEALELLKTFIPDIILLDLIMPRKDGFSTLEDIKKQENLRNIPVIITSNLGQQEEIDRVMAMGATDFITKSNLSLNDLIDKINETVASK
ncbi:MAG TPA: response regulator [Candidatus Saccharimonadales bacterium]|jgi:CheY-like chemotaxis protein|nr:response regulator [Candidatus Saccharimonadales bacterium]